MGKPGSGQTTSSPAWHSARMVKNITGLPPGVITTRSGDVASRPDLASEAATASRSGQIPGAAT
jgi:hypothetical protein